MRHDLPPINPPFAISIGPLYDAGYLAAKAHYEAELASLRSQLEASEQHIRELEASIRQCPYRGFHPRSVAASPVGQEERDG